MSDASGSRVATLIDSVKYGSVALTFKHGRGDAIRLRSGSGGDVVKWFNGLTADQDRIAELVSGTIPDLTPHQPSRFMPYYSYGAGVIRVAIGDDCELGGSWRTPGHEQTWLCVVDGTPIANGAPVVQNGRLAGCSRQRRLRHRGELPDFRGITHEERRAAGFLRRGLSRPRQDSRV